MQCGRALLIDPPSGVSTFAGRVIGGMFDSPGTAPGGNASAAEIRPAGFVYDVAFTGTWFGNSAFVDGLLVLPSGSGVVDGVELTGCEFVDNGATGLEVIGAGAKNVTATGCLSSGNTNYGMSFASACGTFTVTGNRVGVTGVHGTNSIGINIDATAHTDYVVVANNLTGNTMSGLFDATTGTPNRVVANNLT